MVRDIILILCIPVSAYIGFRCAIKAYELGLKHNFELKNNIKPSESKNVVEKVCETYETKEEIKAREEQARAFQEKINEYIGI